MNLDHPIVFYLFGLPIRDTVVMTWILMAIIMVLIFVINKTIPSLFDSLMEFLTGVVNDILDVDNLNPYIPVLGSLFVFIMLANIISIVPGLRSPTADINTTLALALVVFFSVHYYGIRRKGLWGYLKTIANPIYLFPLEAIGQISRTVSLTLRLFGNILSGDLIVAIVFSLIPLILPIPLIALSLASGILQAYILTTLATLYIASAIEVNTEDEKVKKVKLRRNLFQRKDIINGKS